MTSSSSYHSRKPWLDFAATYIAALAGMLVIYLVTERYYFADGKTDFVMFRYVGIHAALVAFLPAMLSAWLLPGKRWLQIVLGLLGGPFMGWAAIKLMHIIAVLA